MKTAILVDGGFYRKRANHLFGERTPKDRANELWSYCSKHLNDKHTTYDLYRIFYYDCPPMNKKVYHPLLRHTIDFSQTALYSWMNEFLNEMKHKRKVALRLGKLSDEQAHYMLKPESLKRLCAGSLTAANLSEADFAISVDQKGVDMKIGIDVASLAYKKQVDQIILISGDSDFVPAAKLARREGIDFILDPMWQHIKDELSEHVDGIMSCRQESRIALDEAAAAAAPSSSHTVI